LSGEARAAGGSCLADRRRRPGPGDIQLRGVRGPLLRSHRRLAGRGDGRCRCRSRAGRAYLPARIGPAATAGAGPTSSFACHHDRVGVRHLLPGRLRREGTRIVAARSLWAWSSASRSWPPPGSCGSRLVTDGRIVIARRPPRAVGWFYVGSSLRPARPTEPRGGAAHSPGTSTVARLAMAQGRAGGVPAPLRPEQPRAH